MTTNNLKLNDFEVIKIKMAKKILKIVLKNNTIYNK
jgi:hypothetical protein